MWECSCSSGILFSRGRAEQSGLRHLTHARLGMESLPRRLVTAKQRQNASDRTRPPLERSAALAALLAIGSFAGPASHSETRRDRCREASPLASCRCKVQPINAELAVEAWQPRRAPPWSCRRADRQRCVALAFSRSRIHVTRMPSKPCQSPAVTEKLKNGMSE